MASTRPGDTAAGAGEVGAALVDQDVNLVWFTGSTTTGRAIYKKCGERFIKMIFYFLPFIYGMPEGYITFSR
jgi:hypothetical protein